MTSLRAATLQDVPALDALFARSFGAALKRDYPPSILVMALPIITKAQPALITSGTFYVMEAESGLIGAGGWTSVAPGTGAVIRGVGHIRHVATDPDAIRQGIARQILTRIVDITRSLGLRRLRCTSTRTAVPFYRAMGFVPLHNVTVPLGPSIDFPAVEMERPH